MVFVQGIINHEINGTELSVQKQTHDTGKGNLVCNRRSNSTTEKDELLGK